MKKYNYFLTGMLALFVCISSCSKDEPVGPASTDNSKLTKSGAQSYSDYQTLPLPAVSTTSVPQLPQTNEAALQFFTDRPTFKSACPGQRDAEDFEGSQVPPGTVVSFTGSLNTTSNNGIYETGAIIPGISLAGISNDAIAVLTTGFIGVASTVVGPNFFADNLEITFGDDEIDAVGIDLLDPIFGPSTLNINIYAPDGTLLGSTVATTGTSVPTFWGVRSSTPIGRICFDDAVSGSAAQLVDNLSADQCR